MITPLKKKMASSSNGDGQDATQLMGLFPRAKPKLCDKCGESYPSITKFNAHRATCKKHKCPRCDLGFTTGQELKEHAGTHRIRFQCDECETAPFHSQRQLENHKKDAHGRAIKCPHCHKTFNWAHIRDEHVKNKHNAETANTCACGESYVKKWQLERHEQQCIVSPIGGANAVKRKYAELVQDNTREEDAILDEAALSTEVFNMVREEAHKKIKSGEESRTIERVCCDTCGVWYKDRESLKRHIRKKHPRSGEAIIASGISESGNETLEINAQ